MFMLKMANQRKYVTQSLFFVIPSRVMAKDVLLHAWLSRASVVEVRPRMISFRKVLDGSAGTVREVAMSIIMVMIIPFANRAIWTAEYGVSAQLVGIMM